MKFGRLTVLRMMDERRNNHIVWECKCDCGSTCQVLGYHLKRGDTKSCGCLEKENLNRLICNRVKHNFTKDPEYNSIYAIWKSMRERCRNPKDKRFNRYGGRGISICSTWEDPKKFVEWALLNGYKKGLTIDRKNNDGNYSPENCHFVPLKENNRNNSNVRVTYDIVDKIRKEYEKGLKQKEIANRYGISQQTVSKIVNYKTWN